MTPDYARARYAAMQFCASCYFQTHSPSEYYADRSKLHLASAAAAMGFVLVPMMPEQPAPEKKPETGTLAELNVKPGDVVEDTTNGLRFDVAYIGDGYAVGTSCYKDGQVIERDSWGLHVVPTFRIVSRASQPGTDDLRAAYDREVLE